VGEERVTGPVPPHQSGLIDFVPSDYFAEFCAQLLFEALLNERFSLSSTSSPLFSCVLRLPFFSP
jgi:hypothetical protein